MILVEVTSLACDKYDRQKEEKCGQKKDTDDRTSREPGLSLSDDSSAEGTGVSVPPEIREATDIFSRLPFSGFLFLFRSCFFLFSWLPFSGFLFLFRRRFFLSLFLCFCKDYFKFLHNYLPPPC